MADTDMAQYILPGATLGVLGGGQLGRMFCVAARTMGYQLVVLDPDPESPAGRIADNHIQADYDDRTALDDLARRCDGITTEFENVPAQSLRYLSQRTQVHPGAPALEIAQNRNREKSYAIAAGLLPVPNAPVKAGTDIAAVIEYTGLPAILKRATLGYDGKGQFVVDSVEQATRAFDSMGGVECVLEKKVELAAEVSAIVCRNASGETACFPVAENRHRNGILHQSIVPARVEPSVSVTAQQQALALAEELEYVGILAVEFFVDMDGALYFNEMAPRPHNSGHYTKDACVTSQFEQQVRMMCGLRPGDTRLISPVVMINLLGELWQPDWTALANEPGVKLHLYGKHQARPGRKMGHFNSLARDVETALQVADRIYAQLAGH
jgi:5-(carboxyamino)imidazole ribonucleotide synthase